MQRFFFFLLLSAFSAGAVMAQSAAEKPSRAEAIALDYAEALDFTDDQRSMAAKVFGKHLAESRSNWNAADGDRETFATAQQTTFKATDTKIKAMLNDAQLAVYMEKRMELKRKALDYYVSQHVKE